MDLLWTDSDGSEAIDVPAQVKALEQKSQATVPVVLVAHGVWPKSPNPSILRKSLGRVESCLLRGLQHASEQQYVGFSGPPRPALKVALSRIQMASTAVEVWKTCHTLALAFGTIRPESGTIKALHAVLVQLLRPGMSDVEASGSTGASKSNFLQ